MTTNEFGRVNKDGSAVVTSNTSAWKTERESDPSTSSTQFFADSNSMTNQWTSGCEAVKLKINPLLSSSGDHVYMTNLDSKAGFETPQSIDSLATSSLKVITTPKVTATSDHKNEFSKQDSKISILRPNSHKFTESKTAAILPKHMASAQISEKLSVTNTLTQIDSPGLAYVNVSDSTSITNAGNRSTTESTPTTSGVSSKTAQTTNASYLNDKQNKQIYIIADRKSPMPILSSSLKVVNESISIAESSTVVKTVADRFRTNQNKIFRTTRPRPILPRPPDLTKSYHNVTLNMPKKPTGLSLPSSTSNRIFALKTIKKPSSPLPVGSPVVKANKTPTCTVFVKPNQPTKSATISSRTCESNRKCMNTMPNEFTPVLKEIGTGSEIGKNARVDDQLTQNVHPSGSVNELKNASSKRTSSVVTSSYTQTTWDSTVDSVQYDLTVRACGENSLLQPPVSTGTTFSKEGGDKVIPAKSFDAKNMNVLNNNLASKMSNGNLFLAASNSIPDPVALKSENACQIPIDTLSTSSSAKSVIVDSATSVDVNCGNSGETKQIANPISACSNPETTNAIKTPVEHPDRIYAYGKIYFKLKINEYGRIITPAGVLPRQVQAYCTSDLLDKIVASKRKLSSTVPNEKNLALSNLELLRLKFNDANNGSQKVNFLSNTPVLAQQGQCTEGVISENHLEEKNKLETKENLAAASNGSTTYQSNCSPSTDAESSSTTIETEIVDEKPLIPGESPLPSETMFPLQSTEHISAVEFDRPDKLDIKPVFQGFSDSVGIPPIDGNSTLLPRQAKRQNEVELKNASSKRTSSVETSSYTPTTGDSTLDSVQYDLTVRACSENSLLQSPVSTGTTFSKEGGDKVIPAKSFDAKNMNVLNNNLASKMSNGNLFLAASNSIPDPVALKSENACQIPIDTLSTSSSAKSVIVDSATTADVNCGNSGETKQIANTISACSNPETTILLPRQAKRQNEVELNKAPCKRKKSSFSSQCFPTQHPSTPEAFYSTNSAYKDEIMTNSTTSDENITDEPVLALEPLTVPTENLKLESVDPLSLPIELNSTAACQDKPDPEIPVKTVMPANLNIESGKDILQNIHVVHKKSDLNSDQPVHTQVQVSGVGNGAHRTAVGLASKNRNELIIKTQKDLSRRLKYRLKGIKGGVASKSLKQLQSRESDRKCHKSGDYEKSYSEQLKDYQNHYSKNCRTPTATSITVNVLQNCIIRKTIQNSYLEGVIPTFHQIHKACDESGITVSVSSLLECLDSLGYDWTPINSHIRLLREDPKFVAKRMEYLSKLEKYSSKNLVYLLASDVLTSKFNEWHINSHDYSRLNSEGVIILHAMSREGLLTEGLLIVKDIHPSFMRAKITDWLRNNVLLHVPKGSVLVFGHSVFDQLMTRDTRPNAQHSKEEIEIWLKLHGVTSFDSSCPKDQLLSLTCDVKLSEIPVCNKIITAECSIPLHIPANHRDLNPLEFIWHDILDRLLQSKDITDLESFVAGEFASCSQMVSSFAWHAVKTFEYSYRKFDSISGELIENIVNRP